MARTVIGTVDSEVEAQGVVVCLEQSGFSRDDIDVLRAGEKPEAAAGRLHGDASEIGSSVTTVHKKESIGDKVADFFQSLARAKRRDGGDHETDRAFYQDELKRGRVLVIVRAASGEAADRASDVMRQHGANQVREEQGPASRREEASRLTPMDERKAEGDRDVRIYAHDEAQEKPTGAPMTIAQAHDSDRQQLLSPQGFAREEFVVEKFLVAEPVAEPGAGSIPEKTPNCEADYRDHHKTAYGNAGGRYDDYSPAYEFGSRMGGEERYESAEFNEAEPSLRRDYEAAYGANSWDRFTEAIRYGWNRGRGKLGRSATRKG